MFNWLKKLFGKTDSQIDPAFPFPKAKEVDQSHMAPYKVEPPATVAAENQNLGNNTVSTAPKKSAPKKPRAPKKKTSTGTGQGRGRKPKAKPAQ